MSLGYIPIFDTYFEFPGLGRERKRLCFNKANACFFVFFFLFFFCKLIHRLVKFTTTPSTINWFPVFYNNCQVLRYRVREPVNVDKKTKKTVEDRNCKNEPLLRQVPSTWRWTSV